MSNDRSKISSPTPSIVFDKLGKLLDDYKQSRSDVKASVPSSPLSSSPVHVDVSKTSLVRHTNRIDLSQVSKYLPADPAIQKSVLSKIIEFYAGVGQLDCFSNFSSDHKLLTSSWRKPSGLDGITHRQCNYFSAGNVDTRMTAAEYGDLLAASNVASGRLVNLVPGVGINQAMYNRETDVIKMKSFEINLMVTPTINHPPTAAPLFDQLSSIVECVVFVDTMAILSNKTNGFGQAIQLLDTLSLQGTVSQSASTLFSLVNVGGAAPTAVYRYPTMMVNPLTHNSRFHILSHKRFQIKTAPFLFTSAAANTVAQSPGDSQFHSWRVDLDPITMPFVINTDIQPYMNNIYMVLFSNSTTGAPNNTYYAVCHYQVACQWQDIGNQ